MKKLLALIMALCLALSAIPALADVAETVADGETLTHDQLVEKAASPPPPKRSANCMA